MKEKYSVEEIKREMEMESKLKEEGLPPQDGRALRRERRKNKRRPRK